MNGGSEGIARRFRASNSRYHGQRVAVRVKGADLEVPAQRLGNRGAQPRGPVIPGVEVDAVTGGIRKHIAGGSPLTPGPGLSESPDHSIIEVIMVGGHL